MENDIEKLRKEIEELKIEIKNLQLPGRCYVCNKPTDGYVRVLFSKTYYCLEHFPTEYS